MHEKLRQERSYRGQNRFIKSFVHNKKNSSLFNPFLGRYNMNNNSDDAARAERIRAKKQQMGLQASSIQQTAMLTVMADVY